MRKLLFTLIIMINVLSCFAAVTDTQSADITGYIMDSESNTRTIYYNVTNSGSEVSSGEYITVGSGYIGSSLQKMFSWNFGGNYYGKNYYSLATLKVKYTISPLKSTSGNAYLPYSYKFDANYTSINSKYLGDSQVTIDGVAQKDTISLSVSGGTKDGIDVTGDVTTSNHTITYSYKMKTNMNYDYVWSRSGDIYIKIEESDYEDADAYTYRATITVEISES